MATREEIETKERADRALRGGRADEALRLYQVLAGKVAVFEPGLYESWLEGALTAYKALGRKVEAAYVLMALKRFSDAEALLSAETEAIEWALCVARLGRRRDAAARLAEAGYLVLAAGELEAAGDASGAKALWDRVLRDPRLGPRLYETALVHAALARVERTLAQNESAARHSGEAQALLAALADDYETRGQRERAFDCFALILKMGKEEGTFENIAEGYINAIRILTADDQRFFALQYMDDFIAEAVTRREWHAAATMALDAADYSRRVGLAFDRHYLSRAADLWAEAARRAAASDMAAEIAENLLSAALDAATRLADLPLCGRMYGQLAALAIPPERKARYQALAERYGGVQPSPPAGPGLPEHLRSAGAYQDIGWDDLVEWELDGAPRATLLLVMLGRTDHVRFVRLALRALLTAARPAGASAAPARAEADVQLCQALGRVQVYEVLRPLERMLESTTPVVRASVMSAAGQVYCKRSFGLVRAGLADVDAGVREEARRALRALHFVDGLDPLIRIFREFREANVRETALAAVADIGSVEAGLFLLDVIREESEPYRAIAAERLSTFPAADLLPVVRSHLQLASGATRRALTGVVQALESVSA
jgi:hypothetical protein